jgi:hypothetical protein
MAYVRVCEGKYDDWFTRSSDVVLLAACFGVPKNSGTSDSIEISLFQTGLDWIDEARAIAAHLQSRSLSARPQYAVRILPNDLQALGLAVGASAGDYGIKWADEHHSDLVGSAGLIRNLVEYVREQHLRGEDRIRRLGKEQVERQFRSFLDQSDGVSEKARSRCERALGSQA